LINNTAIDEVKSSFAYFAETTPGFVINKCFFTGGSSSIPGLIAGMGESLGIEFEALNPFLKVSPPPGLSPDYMRQLAPFASVIIGLALRQVGD
jgi:type IV pilus assembly protein PilM